MPEFSTCSLSHMPYYFFAVTKPPTKHVPGTLFVPCSYLWLNCKVRPTLGESKVPFVMLAFSRVTIRVQMHSIRTFGLARIAWRRSLHELPHVLPLRVKHMGSGCGRTVRRPIQYVTQRCTNMLDKTTPWWLSHQVVLSTSAPACL